MGGSPDSELVHDDLNNDVIDLTTRVRVLYATLRLHCNYNQLLTSLSTRYLYLDGTSYIYI